jgi:hypothetical protein
MASGKRELRPWVPDTPSTPSHLTLDSPSSGGKWDQFAANERLFGVKTEFDESAYTTPLKKDNPGFEERAAKADRLAKEIASKSTTNAHLIEERTGGLFEDGQDEEELYGAVLRETGGDTVPPGFSLPVPFLFSAAATAGADTTTDQHAIVTLPSQFAADRAKINREFTAAQEELAREQVIEVPQSIKSKLNPTAASFVPSNSASASFEDVVGAGGRYDVAAVSEVVAEDPHNYYYQPPQPYYYYDAYGNCFFYDPSQQHYY